MLWVKCLSRPTQGHMTHKHVLQAVGTAMPYLAAGRCASTVEVARRRTTPSFTLQRNKNGRSDTNSRKTGVREDGYNTRNDTVGIDLQKSQDMEKHPRDKNEEHARQESTARS